MEIHAAIINMTEKKGIKNYYQKKIIICIAMHNIATGFDTESYTKKLYMDIDLSFNRMTVIAGEYQRNLREIRSLPPVTAMQIDQEIDKVINGTKRQKEMIKGMAEMLETEYENIPF